MPERWHNYATNGGYDPADGLPPGRWMRDTWGVVRYVEIGEPEQARPPARCGSESGYKAHRRAGEETCEDCRSAHRVAERLRAARRRIDALREAAA